MTRRDTLQTIHEPFGDAYYYGPERLAKRYENDANARLESGFSESTYRTIMDRINQENTEGKRIFIKDMAQYFVPPNLKPASIAPSIHHPKRGIGTNGHTSLKAPEMEPDTSEESMTSGASGVRKNGSHFATSSHVPGTDEATTIDRSDERNVPYPTPTESLNPTVVPSPLLAQFHWTFLIRHPRNSIPSYFRCCVPPLDELTGFMGFRSDEAGYSELRRLFDFLKHVGLIGPNKAGGSSESAKNGSNDWNKVEICVMDADDLLDRPADVISTFCKSVGIDYDPNMLNWDNHEDHEYAAAAFEKWKGFHEDAIASTDLRPRQHDHVEKTDAQHYADWVEKYGEKGAKIIKQAVDDNMEDYEYLKSFAIEVGDTSPSPQTNGTNGVHSPN
ncbi:MAG: hypothetical protein M1831_000568 [Alyxoria varia]|nr:MAG: hypothetical protein M1831_000568 [Alyxoria varia]